MIITAPIHLVYQLFCHWFFDFVCQSKETGETKHKSLKVLFWHVLTYTSLMTLSMAAWTGIRSTEDWHNLLQFQGITFVCHFITDFFTSRYNAKQLKAGRIKRLLNAIAFDQWLHQGQIIFTIYFLYYSL